MVTIKHEWTLSPLFKRILKGTAWTLAGTAGLLCAFHLEENGRGQRAWKAWCQESGRKERPDLAALAPPQVPDEDNFAATPLMAAVVAGRNPGWAPLPSAFDSHARPLGSEWQLGRSMDLEALAKELGVKDLGEAFAPMEPQLEALRQASLKGRCRFQLDYGNPETAVPALIGMRARARALAARAVWKLRKGQSAEALEDVLTVLRVSAHLQGEPHLIAHLLSQAWVRIGLQPVWEGLREGRWDDAQLQRLDAALAKLDLLKSWKRSFAFVCEEDLAGLGSSARLPFWKRAAGPAGGEPPVASAFLSDFFKGLARPAGWMYRDMVALDRDLAPAFAKGVDAEGHRAHPERLAAFATPAGGGMAHPREVLFTLHGTVVRSVKTQSMLDQARVACALERHRKAHGAYPASLAELDRALASVSPLDLITGQPLIYRPAGKAYVLYSPGWNLSDEQGLRSPGGPSAVPLPWEGDWVWRGQE